jgi:hypothetical protein
VEVDSQPYLRSNGVAGKWTGHVTNGGANETQADDAKTHTLRVGKNNKGQPMNEKRIGLGVKLVECNEEAIEEFKDFGPITITLKKPEDIMFLHTACLVFTMNNNMKSAEQVLLLMARMATDLGPEQAVEMAIMNGRQHGFFFPEFYKPLAIAMLNHSLKKARKDADESK